MKVALVAVPVLLLVLLFCSAPVRRDSRRIVYEMSAVRTYRAKHARYGMFAEVRPSGGKLIPPDFNFESPAGYRFKLKLTATGYTIGAAPINFGKPALRTFYSDETGEIHQSWGQEPATPKVRCCSERPLLLCGL